MQIKKNLFFSTLSALLVLSLYADGSIIKINGRYSDDKHAPLYTPKEHFESGHKLVVEKKWEEALANFLVITTHFPEVEVYPDALFFSGVCYYFMEDYQLANRQLSRYLEQKSKLKYFDKVFLYKYHIAEAFRMGAKKHLFNVEMLPRLAFAAQEAMDLYDEVISSLPHQELGAKALYGKAEVLLFQKEYKESIETLSTLIKRFPKDNLAPTSYLLISHIYLEESKKDAQNPDLLALAKINLKNFRRDFPGDEKISEVEGDISSMEEVLATSLFETGRFYEKKKKLKASKIYYEEALKRYPETASAEKCKGRLQAIS
jgi:outer membrane protein assembly factor BamD (BamD/ComL family)